MIRKHIYPTRQHVADSLTERLRDVVGQAPLDYLAGWRMRFASDRLERGGESVASIGFSVGRWSEAAFSRLMGCTPIQHR